MLQIRSNTETLPPEVAWELVGSIQHGSEKESQKALNALCRAYWHPLYWNLRRHGWSDHDAEDLTQALFLHLISEQGFRELKKEAGTVSAFLFGVLRRLISDDARHRHALKRGGHQRTLSLDEMSPLERMSSEPLDVADPQRCLARSEALEIMNRARHLLRATFVAKQRTHVFEVLQPFLSWEDDPPSHGEAARRLGATEGSVRVMVHRLRGEFRQVLRVVLSELSVDSVDGRYEMDSLHASLFIH